ncbi:CBASS cGAMP synthase [Pseudomonas syringae]|uniref:CBASS cGAMP synthase n=1 Tax=Pseudomonas syringae TaxID=317 RepID=UPI00224883DB|nr:CBASS cGAMP synthase [Pseudomonas syringae]UZS69469.1 CBASS cGAMP synthase [Pseudomonas syringae]
MGNSSALFFQQDNENTITARIKLSTFQLAKARECRNALLGFVKPKLSEILDMPVKHWIQGSLKNHTLIRPASKFYEFDIDVGLYLIGQGDCSDIDAKEVKDELHETIMDFCQFNSGAKVSDERKQRCERVSFEKSFHIDLPLYYYNSEDETVLLATENGWEESDPKGFQDWFDASVNIDKRVVVRRIIKYLKSWASIQSTSMSVRPISSMVLTILAVNFFDEVTGSDDEADFANVSLKIVNNILESECVLNPLNGNDILCFDSADMDAWRSKLQDLESVCNEALQTTSQFASYYLWERVFEHSLPPINESPVAQGSTGLPALTVPVSIQVSHYDAKEKLLSIEVVSSIMSYKNENLEFKVSNVSEYPRGSTASWIVRNQGVEAGNYNDLGHRFLINLDAETGRVCAYTGVHYMDVTVYFQGLVQGVGQVKVNVQPYSRPVKNPPRKKYFRGGK